MCGIVDANGSLDLDKLAKDIAKDLPKYARPVFMRIMSNMDMTGEYFSALIFLFKLLAFICLLFEPLFEKWA